MSVVSEQSFLENKSVSDSKPSRGLMESNICSSEARNVTGSSRRVEKPNSAPVTIKTIGRIKGRGRVLEYMVEDEG